MSKSFTSYLLQLTPNLSAGLVILGFIGVLTIINFIGIRESSGLNILCTLIEVSGLAIVIFLAMKYLGSGDHDADVAARAVESAPEVVPSWSSMFQAAALAFYAFMGFEDIVNVAEESKRPERDIPLAIIIALFIAGAIYLLVSQLAIAVLPPSLLGQSEAPLLAVVQMAEPNFPKVVFTAIALFAVLNGALLNFVTSSRLLFGMARERLLPAWIGRVHPKTQTPYVAILLVAPIVIFLALSGTIQYLAGTSATLILLLFSIVNISLFVIKRREPQTTGFRVPLFLPLLALASNVVLIFFASFESKMFSLVLIGIGLLIAGGHVVFARKRSIS